MSEEVIVYYCIDDIGINNEVGEMLKMSIASAVENSGLSVKCLYCGEDEKFVNLLEKIGAEVICIKSRIDNQIIDAHRTINFPLHARGAYLRYEIAAIDNNSYSLYVDCDVFFASEFILPENLPTLVSACNEAHKNDVFNSGVLLFNNANFKKTTQDFLNYATANFGTWTVGVDQIPFNDFYRGSIGRLDDLYNWRPAFGINHDARMIHFHGTKVEEIYYLLVNNIPEAYSNPYLVERANNCSKNLNSLVYYLKSISKFISTENSSSFIKKLNSIIDLFSLEFLNNALFKKNANSLLIENFLLSEPGLGQINKTINYKHRPGVRSIALFPAQNFFTGTIEVNFINCEAVPNWVLSKSTGYLEATFLKSSILIKFCSLSFASELYFHIGDLNFDEMSIKIMGRGFGETTAVDSTNNSIQVSDCIS